MRLATQRDRVHRVIGLGSHGRSKLGRRVSCFSALVALVAAARCADWPPQDRRPRRVGAGIFAVGSPRVRHPGRLGRGRGERPEDDDVSPDAAGPGPAGPFLAAATVAAAWPLLRPPELPPTADVARPIASAAEASRNARPEALPLQLLCAVLRFFLAESPFHGLALGSGQRGADVV